MPLAELVLLVVVWTVLTFLVGAYAWPADRLHPVQTSHREQPPKQHPVEPAA